MSGSYTTNLAQGKMASASSFIMPFSAIKAVDGSMAPTSRWVSSKLGTLTVDLGAFAVVNRWVVRHMGAAGWQSPNYNMMDFKFQGSADSVAWVDIDSVVGNTGAITDRTIADTSLVNLRPMRYFRVNVTKGIACNTKLASIVSFEVYQAQSPFLYNLIAAVNGSPLTLTPTFVGGVYSYNTTAVSAATSSVSIYPYAQDSNATITVNGKSVTNVPGTGIAIDLGPGGTTTAINVVVTSAGVSKTYVVNVPRLAPPSSALTALSVKDGATELVTGFNPATLTYSADVGFGTSSVVVTPTTQDPAATVTVNGNSVARGASATVNLNPGANPIQVVVTSTAGTTTTYTVTVTKASSTYLSALSVSVQPGGTNLVSFGQRSLSYSASVGYGDGTIVVVPTVEDPSATTQIKVNGTVYASGATAPLITGNNTITILVTASSGSSTYTVTVTRANSTYLSSLSVKGQPSGRELITSFIKTTLNYSGVVVYTDANVLMAPAAEDPSATIVIKVNGTASASTAALNLGTNIITIDVSAGGNSTTYTITVIRAFLNNMQLKNGMTNLITFVSTTLTYTATAPTATLKLLPQKSDASINIIVRVNGNAISPTTASPLSYDIPKNGSTIVKIAVVNGAIEDSNPYTITLS